VQGSNAMLLWSVSSFRLR